MNNNPLTTVSASADVASTMYKKSKNTSVRRAHPRQQRVFFFFFFQDSLFTKNRIHAIEPILLHAIEPTLLLFCHKKQALTRSIENPFTRMTFMLANMRLDE